MLRKRSLDTDRTNITTNNKYYEFCLEMYENYPEKSNKFASSTKSTTVKYNKQKKKKTKTFMQEL